MGFLTDFMRELPLYLLSLPVVLMALSIHESAHGYAAYKLGDPTARNLGRITLNPVKHFDLLGFLSMLVFHVGWAKPGTDSLYNIVMMEELHTVLSVGGGGVTKLVDPAAGKIVRLPNPKYPHDYLATLDKVLAQKQEIVNFYSK